MDRQVRWFTREIIVSVAQRLFFETVVVGFVALAAMLVAGAGALWSVIGAVLILPTFAALRVISSCLFNPINSAYLIRWPHPSGEIKPVERTNQGGATDTTLQSLDFTPRGAIDEWGGAVTNVYTRNSNKIANQIIGLTSDEEDLVVLSRLTDDRFVVTTKQLIAPHEQLIVNHSYQTATDAVIASHLELLKALEKDRHRVVSVTLDDVFVLLAIEWSTWDQIGPLVGPFVALGQGRPLGLLQIRVPAHKILDRSLAKPPRVTAGQRVTATRWSSEGNITPPVMRETAPAVVIPPSPAIVPSSVDLNPIAPPAVPSPVLQPPPIPATRTPRVTPQASLAASKIVILAQQPPAAPGPAERAA